jgi:nucleoside-diphosphate-sugar epimerase
MRVFVTGATGFIGSAIVKELIDAGHQVTGLARSDASAKKLDDLGAQSVRGDIEDLDVLRKAAANSQGVVHTAFYHKLTHMKLHKRLGVLLGGGPSGIVGRFLAAAVGADRRALETLGKALTGPDRPLVAAFGTLYVQIKPGAVATEDDTFDPNSAGAERGKTEATMWALASSGIRTSIVRLPPVVHGVGDRGGFAPMLFQIAQKKKESGYVGDGSNRWPAVHRLDAARLFRLALENGTAGATYHAVGEEGVPFKRIAEVLAKRLNVPVVSKSPEQAAKQFSFLAPFIPIDNPASSQLTQERLGWKPIQPEVISDLSKAAYFED